MSALIGAVPGLVVEPVVSFTRVEQYDEISGSWYDSGREFDSPEAATDFIAAWLLGGDRGRFLLVSTTSVEISSEGRS